MDINLSDSSFGQDTSVYASPAGISFLSDFWTEKYLQEYIRAGGSKIKFVTGRCGSGKTYFLHLISEIALKEHYKTATFSAREIWLHDFKEIYREILKQVDLTECLTGCSHRIIKEMGFDYHEIPDGLTFIDYLAQHDMSDALNRREIRTQLKIMFLDNPLLDNNFALACSMLTGSILGYPLLEESNRELLLSWLEGDRTIKLSLLRSLGLSPSRITKFNARHMLRSLSEVVRLAGYSGILVTIDDLEILLSRSSLEAVHYTKMKREDTYESIRQLIDDIDTMKNIMFVFAFDRELIDNENAGIKSYQALWMRIQNEIVGERFNRFADIIDLDRLAAQEYTPTILAAMSKNMTQTAHSRTISPINEETAAQILRQARLGNVGIPQLIRNATLGGEH